MTVLATRKEFIKFCEYRVKAGGEHIAAQVTQEMSTVLCGRTKPVNCVNTICNYNSVRVVSHKLVDDSSIDVAYPMASQLYIRNMGGIDLAD